jgi:HD-like signal output (HDOD) protein
VADGSDIASWERSRPLEDDLLDLERRVDREPAGEPLAALREAITRHLCKRAANLGQELPTRGEETSVAPQHEDGDLAARRVALGAILSPQALQQRLRHLRSLPTLPKLLERVIAALEDPEVNFDSVAELIEIDQALTSQILRLANSAFYSAQGSVSRVTQALVVLGIVVSRSVVLSSGILDIRSVGLRGFWEHSLGCAVAAGALAKVTGLASPEEVTAAGLLHDLGKVALYKELPDVFEYVVASAAAEDRAFRDVEQAVLGMDHCDIVAPLVEKWHFPACLAEPIMFHHRPARARIARHETVIVHVANVMVRAIGYGSGGDTRVGSIDPAAWAELELTPARLDQALDLFDSDLDHALNYAVYE